MALLQNFSISQNTDDILSVFVESDLTYDSLVGTTIEWTVLAQEYGIPLESPIVIYKTSADGGIVIPSSPSMTFYINLTHLDTRDLDVGVYYHDAIVIDGAGNRSKVLYGLMAITL